MDSKYNAISNNQPDYNPFNFKRKLTNGSLNSSNNDQLKHFKSNNSGGNDFQKNNSSNSGQSSNGKSLTIEEQRHQLPVYKVRKQ